MDSDERSWELPTFATPEVDSCESALTLLVYGDKRVRIDPTMSLPLSALHPCASCAEEADSKFRCARCHTVRYCSRPCQVAHWASGGHKEECKALARARRDTNLEA